jgi:hypothetical protein
MRRLAAIVALVIPFLAAIACGGRVGLVGDGGGGTCPSQSEVLTGAVCSSAGQTCTTTYSFCGSSESVQCTCTSGTWTCPSLNGPGCVVPACPAADSIQQGDSCDLATQSSCMVPLSVVYCNGLVVSSLCECEAAGDGSGAWACLQPSPPECADAQPPGCPDPSTVANGNGCNVSPQLSCSSGIPIYDCNGNVTGDATCQCFGGAWSCVTPEPNCPPTGCPDPEDVEQGISCQSPGLQCPGNPTDCDGAIFYDAFECDSGEWNDVAVTGCSGSGSSSGGGGGPVDAGAAPDAKGM